MTNAFGGTVSPSSFDGQTIPEEGLFEAGLRSEAGLNKGCAKKSAKRWRSAMLRGAGQVAQGACRPGSWEERPCAARW